MLSILAPLDNLSVGVISHLVFNNHSVNFTLHSLAAFSMFLAVPFSANKLCTLFALLTCIPPPIQPPIPHKIAHIAVSFPVANLHSAPNVVACAQAAHQTVPANAHCATPHNTVVAGVSAAVTNHHHTAVAPAANAVVAAVLPTVLPIVAALLCAKSLPNTSVINHSPLSFFCNSCSACILVSSTHNHLAIAAPAFSHNLPVTPTMFCHTSLTHCANQAAAAPNCCHHLFMTPISQTCLSLLSQLAIYLVSPDCFASDLF